MLTEKEIEKIEKFKELLENRLKQTSKEPVVFYYAELARIPLLSNKMALKKILDIIQLRSNRKIYWEEITRQILPEATCANPEPKFLAPVPIGIEVSFDDQNKLDEYFISILENKNEVGKEAPEKQSAEEKKRKSGGLRYIHGDHFVIGSKKIAAERGQKSMIIKFLENAQIFHGKTLARKGTELEVSELIVAGKYKHEPAFRDGLKRLRNKIENAKFPVEIKNTEKGKYLMIIKD